MQTSTLDRLAALAREKSSENRRQLLRELSDLFIDSAEASEEAARDAFAKTASLLLDQLEVEVRREFAVRFADETVAPGDLMAKLAHDVIEVARPVLLSSDVLDDAALLEVIAVRGEEHMRAVSERSEVSERISDAIIARGDDDTVARLVRNKGASISRDGFDKLNARSRTAEKLREPLAVRPDTPPDVLNELLLLVERRVRRVILQRFARLDPSELDAALEAAHARVGSQPRNDPEMAAARRKLREITQRRPLTPSIIIDLWRGGDETTFLLALGEFTEAGYETAKRFWNAEDVDCLAMALRAAGADRAFFVTIAIERDGVATRDNVKAKAYGESYEAIPVDAARRVMRFFNMRRELGPDDDAVDAA